MPLNINFQMIFLHALNLVILVAGMYYILLKPMQKFMDARAQKYQAMQDEAQARQAEAEKLYATYAQQLQNADAEIRARSEEAMAQTELRTQEMLDSARQQSEKMLEKAREDAARTEKKMLRHAQSEIARLSLEAAHKLMDKPLTHMYDEFLTAAEGSEANGRS